MDHFLSHPSQLSLRSLLPSCSLSPRLLSGISYDLLILLLCPWPSNIPLSPELPLEDDVLGQLQHSPTKHSPVGQPRPFGLPREVVGSSPRRPPPEPPGRGAGRPARGGPAGAAGLDPMVPEVPVLWFPSRERAGVRLFWASGKFKPGPTALLQGGLLLLAIHWGRATANKSFLEGGCYPKQ